MFKKDSVDLMHLAISTQKVAQIFLLLMVTGDWTAKQQLVREHEDDLLDPIVFRTVVLYMAEGDPKGTLKSLVQYHCKLITRCLEVGIDAAFADAALQQEFQALLLARKSA